MIGHMNFYYLIMCDDWISLQRTKPLLCCVSLEFPFSSLQRKHTKQVWAFWSTARQACPVQPLSWSPTWWSTPGWPWQTPTSLSKPGGPLSPQTSTSWVSCWSLRRTSTTESRHESSHQSSWVWRPSSKRTPRLDAHTCTHSHCFSRETGCSMSWFGVWESRCILLESPHAHLGLSGSAKALGQWWWEMPKIRLDLAEVPEEKTS